MKRLLIIVTLLLLTALVTSVAAQSVPVELRITWYDDGNEGAVLRDLLDRFEADNPDIKVTIDTVAYNTILEQLPIQVEAGEGPDMARVTSLTNKVFRDRYLDLRPLVPDADYWDTSFPPIVLQAMRPDGDTSLIAGFPNQFTITGPYINKTLFDQAGVEVPTGDVSWEQWTDLSKQVAEVTGTQYAVAMDRSGHRFAGPAISMGATYFDADGNVTIDSPGFRDMANILKGWHDEGITPSEVWLGAGGSYAAAADYFINSQVVFYMSGSWQVGNFSSKIGDTFDWVAVHNPTGPGGSTGMPGGSAMVAFASTQHPQEVARVMDYLVQPDTYREFTARTLFIPGHIGLGMIDYQTDSALARDALNMFGAQVPEIADQAYQLNFHPYNTVIFNETRDRLTQWMTGELTLDEAIQRAQQAVDDAVTGTASS